jgi:hypothetical protein
MAGLIPGAFQGYLNSAQRIFQVSRRHQDKNMRSAPRIAVRTPHVLLPTVNQLD